MKGDPTVPLGRVLFRKIGAAILPCFKLGTLFTFLQKHTWLAAQEPLTQLD
ncbi:MAG: hypothetical protein V3T40_07400 [Nitrososphaerales archaeon]